MTDWRKIREELVAKIMWTKEQALTAARSDDKVQYKIGLYDGQLQLLAALDELLKEAD